MCFVKRDGGWAVSFLCPQVSCFSSRVLNDVEDGAAGSGSALSVSNPALIKAVLEAEVFGELLELLDTANGRAF